MDTSTPVDDTDSHESQEEIEMKIDKPALSFTGKLKELTLSKKKKIYVKAKKIKFKGKVPDLVDGYVDIYIKHGKHKEKKRVYISSNGIWNKRITFDQNGTWRVKFVFYNKNGKKIDTLGSYKVKIDTHKPEFTNLPMILHKHSGDVVWFEAKDDKYLKKFKVYFNGRHIIIYPKKKAKNGQVVRGEYVLPHMSPGVYVMKVKVYDKARNTTSQNVQIVIQ